MSSSPTAELLASAINASNLTQREIASQVGFNKPNIISMMKNGDARVPINRIPALARILDLDPKDFLLVAMAEYHPEVHQALIQEFGLPLTETELKIVRMLREAKVQDDPNVEASVLDVLQSMLALANKAGLVSEE